MLRMDIAKALSFDVPSSSMIHQEESLIHTEDIDEEIEIKVQNFLADIRIMNTFRLEISNLLNLILLLYRLSRSISPTLMLKINKKRDPLLVWNLIVLIRVISFTMFMGSKLNLVFVKPKTIILKWGIKR